MNPKAACLKRREEEKGTEFLTAQSASVYPDHVAPPLVVRICTAICQSSNTCFLTAVMISAAQHLLSSIGDFSWYFCKLMHLMYALCRCSLLSYACTIDLQFVKFVLIPQTLFQAQHCRVLSCGKFNSVKQYHLPICPESLMTIAFNHFSTVTEMLLLLFSNSKQSAVCSTCIIPALPVNCQFIWMACAFGMSATQPILG